MAQRSRLAIVDAEHGTVAGTRTTDRIDLDRPGGSGPACYIDRLFRGRRNPP